ncbi:MAG: hypothetical protein RLZ12_414 [Bacillota bacterium]
MSTTCPLLQRCANMIAQKHKRCQEFFCCRLFASAELGQAPLLEKMKLFEWRFDADLLLSIDPLPIGLYDYESGANFFIQEIKKTGIDITKQVGLH